MRPRSVCWTCLALLYLPLSLAGCTGDGDSAGNTNDPIESADAGDDLDAGESSMLDGGEEVVEAGDEPDVGADDEDAEAGREDAEAGTDLLPQMPATEGRACQTNDDCNDEIYCNGTESCELAAGGKGTCRRALTRPCSNVHPCIEATRECQCERPDYDRDNYVARECGGPDCDDSTGDCSPKGQEVCDPDGRDEDCNAKTFFDERTKGTTSLDGDNDHDGYVGSHCRNRDQDTGDVYRGDDCNDADVAFKPGIPEVCNYLDDDCNGHVDELRDPVTTNWVDGALRITFLPDLDKDLRGDKNATPLRACDFYQPRGYIIANPDDALDCNDKSAAIFFGAPEECDGLDNDCDGAIDAQDVDLVRRLDFTGTTLACTGGAWVIPSGGCPGDKLWCPGDPIEQGCARDGTRLSSCRACNTDCRFSCGIQGCDEIVQIGARALHTCARTREGRLACWGRGAYGRLGDDGTVARNAPSAVVGLETAYAVALGVEHTCAIAGPARQVWCWGRNDRAQLGGADADLAQVPVRASEVGGALLTDAVSVGAGFKHTCVVKASGALLCFGSVRGGRLGANLADSTTSEDETRRAVPVLRLTYDDFFEEYLPEVISDAIAVSAGENHSCALLRSGQVGCWGDNSLGQVGSGGVGGTAINFQLVPQLANVSKISCGDNHTCAISGREVFCWGSNGELQLGRASGADNASPGRVALEEPIIDVVAGRAFTCALTESRRVACWGTRAVLGVDQPAPSNSQQPVWIPINGITALSSEAGQEHVCVRAGDSAICWGGNSYGQLGIGTQTRQSQIPTRVNALTGSLP